MDTLSMTPMERVITYLSSQVVRCDIDRVAVTISRQTGSGAIAIADILAEHLRSRLGQTEPWAIFDKNLMTKVLEEHDLPGRLAEFLPEDQIPVIRDWIEEALGLHPEYRVVVQQSAETILKLAMLGNVIIIGRGANIITSRLPNVLRVRLVGSLQKRVARVEKAHNLTREEAEAYVRKSDAGRSRYISKYFGKSLSDPLLYDFTLNTDHFSTDEAARLIGDAVLSRHQALEAALKCLAH